MTCRNCGWERMWNVPNACWWWRFSITDIGLTAPSFLGIWVLRPVGFNPSSVVFSSCYSTFLLASLSKHKRGYLLRLRVCWRIYSEFSRRRSKPIKVGVSVVGWNAGISLTWTHFLDISSHIYHHRHCRVSTRILSRRTSTHCCCWLFYEPSERESTHKGVN